MLNRLSANALLKSVIGVLAMAIVVMLTAAAWTSWQRLMTANRIEVAAEASASLFTALDNMRFDRSFTFRGMAGADRFAGPTRTDLEKYRSKDIPALKAAAEQLAGFDFPERSSLLSSLDQAIRTLTTLHQETWAALDKPKAERPEGLIGRFMSETQSYLDLIDKLSAHVSGAVKRADPYVDQLFALRQIGSNVRTAAGDSSVAISNTMAGQPVTAETFPQYMTNLGRLKASWQALEDLAYGATLPASFTEAMDKARRGYFDPAYTQKRDQMMKALVSHETTPMTAAEWTPMAITKVNSLQAVPETAIAAIRDYAGTKHAEAVWDLVMQLVMLGVALLVAAGAMVAVSRRVIRPLHQIQDAMLKVASGDLSAEAAFPGRTDEIGALAGALGTFKQNAAEKARIEEEQKDRNAQRAKRQEAIEGYIKSFEGQVREALEALGTASGQMLTTSDGISKTAERSTTQVQAVASASEEASANVQTVAAASEQLSGSIAEISQQVARAANIAGRAVEETKQTDGTVQGLVEAAARIGEVVKLINDIAGQTNLLALNATIEAARAGEAGKGFAVVASEVKSLANQTAKATEDISAQITAVQNVTKDAVEAIKRIGGTIGEVSSVATSIASAVEEQGAATKEITRNTHEAAQRTKDVSKTIVDVREGANATGSAAQGVKSAAGALRERTEQLRAGVNEFLEKIRAA
jgi:methyl-accepting chemotaxis protein